MTGAPPVSDFVLVVFDDIRVVGVTKDGYTRALQDAAGLVDL